MHYLTRAISSWEGGLCSDQGRMIPRLWKACQEGLHIGFGTFVATYVSLMFREHVVVLWFTDTNGVN
jgi:hypothetical protein